MIGCLRIRVRKQAIVTLYFEFETELKFYNLEDTTWENDKNTIKHHKHEPGGQAFPSRWPQGSN